MKVREFRSPPTAESSLLLGSEARHRFYFTQYSDALAFVRGMALVRLVVLGAAAAGLELTA